MAADPDHHAALVALFETMSGLRGDATGDSAPAVQTPDEACAEILRRATDVTMAMTAPPPANTDPRAIAHRQLATARAVFDLALTAIEDAGAEASADVAALEKRVADFQTRMDALGIFDQSDG
jgi:hypothetical protein